MKKLLITLLTLTLSLLSILSLCSCSVLSLASEETEERTEKETATKPKVVDEEYIYDWLVDNGQLVNNGTGLVYEEKTADGKTFRLRYDIYHGGEEELYAVYSVRDRYGYPISVKMNLFEDDSKILAHINTISSYGYNRGLYFYHNPKNFTKNATIELGGITIDGWLDENGLDDIIETEELLENRTIISILRDIAQESLCELLDWIKEDFCPKADIEMSDLGYLRY